jgi:L-seryl-tRNA(Ser) seleniumtransferase
VTLCVRDRLDEMRREATAGDLEVTPEQALELLVDAVEERLERRLGRRLGRVLNATGIFLHTNLGRSPLPRGVAWDLPAVLDAYCDLEIDSGTGRRGDRNRRAARLLETLTGAEAALVTNNNAAALVLALATLARDRQVVVSRGELVEIGGSFRIPDILSASGAELVEVGTTNRTRVEDYRRALSDRTALLLKVHRSNYRITGFTEEAGPAALVALAREHDLPLLIDEGSGLLRPHRAPQLGEHPSMSELVALGCDLVCGSGDKLTGGPQAGLLVGRRDLVEACHRHPLYRALRPDRACFAALEGVLRLHLAGGPLPIDRLWVDEASHRRRLERVVERCGGEIVEAEAYVGGGAAPEAPIPGLALALTGRQPLLERLRLGEPPVFGCVRDDRVVLDLRTVDPADDEALVAAVRTALGGERRV